MHAAAVPPFPISSDVIDSSTPNLCSDAHDCSLATADNWPKTNINPFIQSSTFMNGGLLIIVFDESQNDNSSQAVID
jgi:hypothetical protein